MLVDANVLLYAVDEESPHVAPASGWLIETLDGPRRVALPWQTIGAFLRIATHPRIVPRPLTSEEAWSHVDEWLAHPRVWIPQASGATARILGDLLRRYQVTANAIPDAQLAALAIEHGIPVVSADTDFARFSEITWVNPLARR